MKHHDVIVIGTGSCNSVIDPSMADWDIGLIDQRKTGGTCLNRRCIPSKTLGYTAEVVDTANSVKIGIPATDLARRSYWIHPALTEVVQNALLDVSDAA